MDKFDNAAEAGRSMLTGETVKEVTKTSVISPDKSSRSLWAVSMCSLIAVASLSCILVADRNRIAQLEAELASTHENRHLIDSLNRPEVMARVLSLAQTGSSQFSSSSVSQSSISSSSVSQSSVNVNISGTRTTTTTQQGTLSEQQDHEIIDAFSGALHDELARLDSRIMTINASWSSSQTDITQLQSDVNELEVSTTDIKIDVTSLMNNYDDLDVTVTGIQEQVDTLNGIIDNNSDDAKNLITRLTNLEDDSVVIRGDVDTIQVTTINIENQVTGIQDTQSDLTIKVDGIQSQVDTLEGVFSDAGNAAGSLEDRMQQLESDSTMIQGDITVINQNADDLHIEVDAISDRVTSIEGRIMTDGLDAAKKWIDRIKVLETDSQTLQVEMDTEQSTTIDLQSQIDGLGQTANQINVRLTGIETDNTNLTTDVDVLQGQVDTIIGAFGDHKGKAAVLNTRLTTIETDADTVSGRVTGLEQDTASLQVSVTSLDGRVTVLENTEYNELIMDGTAERLDQCQEGCAVCMKGYYAFYPDHTIYQCVDTNSYAYGDKCEPNYGKWSVNKCATGAGQYCQQSWLVGDELEAASPDAACRTVPQPVVNDIVNYGPNCDDTQGLCVYGCTNGNWCAHSWPREDPLMMNSLVEMCRCTKYHY